MKFKFTSRFYRNLCLQTGVVVLSSFFSGCPFWNHPNVPGNKDNSTATPIKTTQSFDPVALLKLKPGYHNLEKDENGKVRSVLIVVNIKTPRINDISRQKSRLKADGILAELVGEQEVSVIEKVQDKNKDRTITKKTTANLAGYIFRQVALGMDAQKTTMITVYHCTYVFPPTKSSVPPAM